MPAVTPALAEAHKGHPLYGRFTELGLPGNKTEPYRRFAVRPLLERDYTPIEATEHTPAEGDALVIENGVVTEIPKGVSVTFERPLEGDETHYDALYFLSHLVAPTAVSLEVSGDIRFEIRHRFDAANSLLPLRLHLRLAPNVRAEVFETFETGGSAESLMLYGVDADIGRDATLRWVRSHNADADSGAVIGGHRFDVDTQGALELKTFDFGDAKALHLYKIDLAEHAWCDAAHLLLCGGDTRRGNVVVINHDAPYAKSVQEARSILRGEATGIFDGRIRIGHDARYASAHQNSKAILLDEHAFMYAKPQLEIYTDELEASHGSTTGQLDEAQLFYLRSRGIAEEEARRMLVLAFADTLIEGIGDAAYVERVRAEFEEAFLSD